MKLRLLMTKKCNRNCEGCCNKDFDLDALPVVESYKDYDMIMITGGEPLLFPTQLGVLLFDIQMATEAPIYVYTAKMDDINLFTHLINHTDGITLTIHEPTDFPDFLDLCNSISPLSVQGKSMRLNIFNDAGIPESSIPSWWDYKYIDWIKDCPLPKDEEFKRVKFLA